MLNCDTGSAGVSSQPTEGETSLLPIDRPVADGQEDEGIERDFFSYTPEKRRVRFLPSTTESNSACHKQPSKAASKQKLIMMFGSQ